MLSACPACGTADILLKIPGTKAVEEELVRLFPSSRIKRFDSDNTKPNKLEIHAESIRRGDVDIIVGTQVLIKGFDIPRLAVLGIVNADTALSFPDYTAVERTFQQITQAVGRVGRGHGDATVIVQTHNPKSSVIKNALSKDWDSFYSQELSIRQTQQLPPFSHILKVECLRATSSSAQSRMREFAESIAKEPGLTIRGPAPAFRPATMGKAVWQIIVASKKRSDILDTIQKLPSGFRYDIDPLDLL